MTRGRRPRSPETRASGAWHRPCVPGEMEVCTARGGQQQRAGPGGSRVCGHGQAPAFLELTTCCSSVPSTPSPALIGRPLVPSRPPPLLPSEGPQRHLPGPQLCSGSMSGGWLSPRFHSPQRGALSAPCVSGKRSCPQPSSVCSGMWASGAWALGREGGQASRCPEFPTSHRRDPEAQFLENTSKILNVSISPPPRPCWVWGDE